MARLLWLADVLRAAGLTVHEIAGWRTRGADTFGPVRGVIVHETRGSATSTDAGEINVLVNGRTGLSGPIAQLYLSRTGHWHVVASGTCHHVTIGYAGPFAGYGNDALLGVEAQHALSEDWAAKPVQYASYVRGVAAILRRTGWPPPVGHLEHQPGAKTDPEYPMGQFRADVAAVLAGEDLDMTPEESRQLFNIDRLLTALLLDTDDVSGLREFPGDTTPVVYPLKLAQRVKALEAAAVADETRDKATLAAITALTELVKTGGGDADAAAILARIDEAAAQAGARFTALSEELATVRAQLTEAEADRQALQARLDGVPDAVADELHQRTGE